MVGGVDKNGKGRSCEKRPDFGNNFEVRATRICLLILWLWGMRGKRMEDDL